MRSVRSLSVCGVFTALFVLVSPAAAQRAAGPFEGILGGSDPSDARQTFYFRGSVYGAWDDVSSEIQGPGVDNRFLRSGFAGGAFGGLTYARRGRRTQWLSSANSEVRAYGTDSDAVAATFGARTGLNVTLSTRVTLVSSIGVFYSPYYAFSPTLDRRFTGREVSDGNFGVATAAQRNLSADGAVGVNVQFSRRDALETHANARRYAFLDQPNSDTTWYGGRATFRHTVTRTFGLHAGLAREEAGYQTVVETPRLSTTTIDIGVDYGDTLQFSRRTAFSFSSSTSAVRWLNDLHFRLNATAALTRAFGRTGSGALQYTRDTNFTAGFREPLLTDTFGGGLSEQIGRRSSWWASAGYTRGTIGFNGDTSSRFNSYYGGGRLTTALTRKLAVFGDYAYYRYQVPAGSTIFLFLPKFSRQTVSVGLSVWAPIINDTRPPTPVR